MAKKLKMTFAYDETEYTRNYDFDVAESVQGSAMKDKILAVNASLRAGTDGGLSDFFVSDAGDNFASISSAKLVETDKTYLVIGGDSAASIS